MHMLQSLFYLTIALHVSGIIITHLQERKTTVTTASVNRYTVIDRVKFLLLTLRLLMSYIYMEHLFLMFLDHTQRRTTVGRTPLDE